MPTPPNQEKDTGITAWLLERLPAAQLTAFFQKKSVPQHRHSFWYLLGGLSLFFFIVQVVSGVLLLFYYSPTPETAYESVRFIIDQAPFGWAIRSIHHWSSHLMIVSVFLHLFSTYLMKAYRKPREMMWLSGVLQFFLVLGFGFTGYLLPWDTVAYFATQIGTEIPKSIPFAGDMVAKILRGGEFVEAETLKRLFALHVVVLPFLSFLIVGAHLYLNQFYGTSTPIGVAPLKPGLPFFPNYVFRDVISWTMGMILLLGLVLIFPVELGTKADPYASAPLGIKPEWYFIPLFQSLRLFPANFMGLSGEMVVNFGVILFSLGMFLVPFLDKKASREAASPVFTVIGYAAIAYLVLTIVLGYTT